MKLAKLFIKNPRLKLVILLITRLLSIGAQTPSLNYTKKITKRKIECKSVYSNGNSKLFEFVFEKQTEFVSINKDEIKKKLKKSLISSFIKILKHLFTRFIEYMFTNLLI